MASRKPNKDRRKQEQRRRRLKRLSRRLPPGPSGAPAFVVAPAGREKMSEALEALVAPFRRPAETEAEFRNLLNLGMLAWNAALLPEDRRRAMIEQVLGGGLSEATDAVREEARALVNVLVQRKQDLFPTNRRLIISFQLMDAGHEYQLLVAATL
jgi:hypothetical protein